MKKIYTLLCFYILFCANVFSAVPVTDWLLLGPIQSTPDQMFSRPYLPEETILPNLNESFGDMKWIKATAGNNGIVDLYSALSAERSKRYLVAYACAYVYSEYDMPAQLLMGSDDGLQVWLNGLKVWQINVNRGTNAGEDVVNVMLSKGLNCLLLKINQDYEGWSFCCSVASDYPVKGVIMNPMKIVSKPATTTKVWIPELSFRSTVSGSTDAVSYTHLDVYKRQN